VERRAGRAVADIFERWGERRFRKLEEAEIRRVSARGRQVAALGGAPCSSRASWLGFRRRGSRLGSPAASATYGAGSRARSPPGRSLRGGGAAPKPQEAAEVLRARADYPAGDLKVSTSRFSPAQAAAAVMKLLAEAPRAAGRIS